MHTLNPTKDTGATAKASDVVYVEPDRTETDASLAAQVGLDGVNAAFVADFLSACLTHERCGTHLYRSVAGRTANPMLQARYEQFGRQTVRHVEILEDVITASGGNPAYVSPLARAVQAADTKALEATFLGSGGIDPMAAEMAMLDAVFMAETVDHANWEALGQVAASLSDGAMRDALSAAVREVEEDEDEHLSWARDTRARLTMLQVSSSVVTEAMASGEELVARIKGWFDSDGGDSTVGDADERPTAPTATKRSTAATKTVTKKAAAKRPAGKKKATTKKSATKKKAATKRSPAKKKAGAKRSPAKKKAATKKAAAKKSPTKKKAAAKRSTAKKRPAAKKATKRSR